MKTRTLAVAALMGALAYSTLPLGGGQAQADEQVKPAPKPKPTKASVQALQLKLAKASVAIKAMAEKPAPKGLTPAQAKAYAAEMSTLKKDAAKSEEVAALIAKRLELGHKVDSLSEMGEMESLRLQMAMDRMAKALAAMSNLLKKQSDTASQIIQNLK